VKLNSNHQTALQHSSITSNMQKSLRRCRSASTIRKKLLNAVEQDNSTSTISKFSTACTQSDQNTSSSRTPTRRPNSAAPNATVVANILSVPGLPAAYRATLRPSSTAYTSLVSSGPLQESKTIARKQEQELDKRLSDLEKISFPDDQTAINAWLNTILFTMDDVIQQDKGFASILFRIRHEVERLMVAKINAQRTPAMTVVEQDLTSNHHRNEFSNGCNCNCHEESNNVHKEVLALRKENKILKKNITAMETQLEMLQFSSMYTEREDVTQDNEKEVVDTHEEEEQELDDILLCNPYDDDVFSNRLYEEENESQGGKTSTHVHNIPQLNLSFLLPYNEEEEEDNDDDHYDEDYQAQEYEQE
jgi:hypothetical protein